MSFPLNIYALALTSAALVAFVSLPLWRNWCLRIGLVDDPGHRKIHDHPIPLAGGLAVLTGLIAPLCAAFLVFKLTAASEFAAGLLGGVSWNPLEHGFSRRTSQLLAIAFGACGMVVLGLIDDRVELSPAVKFSGQLLMALLVAAAGVRITLFVESHLFSFAVTVLWILTLTNAMNFMDNMNGLCAGIGLMAAWTFGWLAAQMGQYLVATLGFLIAGALLGFLPHNFPKARAFLGDSGSHLIGYLLAVLAILPHFHTAEAPRRAAVLIPLLVLAVPLVDLASVVVIRLRAGKPFYVGDTNHLSHRLVRRGMTPAMAVLVILLLASLAGAAAVALL